jgi:rRNA maturation endonuclease Nob1
MNLGSMEVLILFLMCLPVLLIIGIGVYLFGKKGDLFASRRKCPHCAEWIKAEAVVCRYCGRDVPPTSVKQNE